MAKTLRIWFIQVSHRLPLRQVLITGLVGIFLVCLTPLEDLSYDVSFQIKPNTTITNAVLVYANQQTLGALGSDQRFLDRTKHVQLLNRLKQDGARLVFYDWAFTGPDKDSKVDQALAQAITNQGLVILVVGGESSESVIGPMDQLLRSNTPALLLNSAEAWGHAELLGSAFNVVRRISGKSQNLNYAVWAAATQIEPRFQDEKPNLQRWLNYYGGPNRSAIEKVSFEEVFRNEVRSNVFSGKCVFVGQAIPGDDTWATPFSRFGRANPMPGVEIHATAFLNLLRDDWLRLVPKPWQCLGAAMWAIIGVAGLYSLSRKPMIVVVFTAALGALLLCAASLYVQWHCHWWWGWIGPAFGQTSVALILVCRNPKPDPYVAFISHRTAKDRDAALLIQKWLSERAYKTFIDVENLRTGKFDEQLFRAIDDASFFILILSPNSLDRCVDEEDWIRREMVHAFSVEKTIIPVFKDGFRFDDETNLPRLPVVEQLKRFQGVDYSNSDFEGFMRKLLKMLEEKPAPTNSRKLSSSATSRA